MNTPEDKTDAAPAGGFEKKLAALEELVDRMESGKLGLDEMIAAYEQGRKLSDDCRGELDAVRKRIEKVTASGATEEFKP